MSDQGMRQLFSRIGNMFARGRVRSVNAAGRMQVLQVDLLAGETKDRLEHFEPYGFTSHPLDGAEAATAFLDGDRSHGLVLVVADRRYRLRALQAGEMAIHDDQGQKVHLTRDGIVVDGAGLPMIFTNTPSITHDTPDVYMTGRLHVEGDIIGAAEVFDHMIKSMSDMREVYNDHDHDDPVSGVTSDPNQDM